MYTPKFSITNTILKYISMAEAAKEIIDRAPLLPFYEKKFQTEALVRAVHFGTHIEGNELNLSQAEKVMMGQPIAARERDIQEVINYRAVMEYIGEWGDENIRKPIDEDLLLHLHLLTIDKILPSDQCGIYRKTQVVIRNSHTGEVSFRPPLAAAVPFQIIDLLAFINSLTDQDINPILKSGIVHYELVRIHPFIDGNGRVARALSTLILFQEKYDIRKFFSLEEYFDSNATGYYEALQSVENHQGDVTGWLEYFTEGLAIELGKIRDKVESVSIDANIRQKLGGKPFMLTDRQLKIVEYIQKTGFLQNKAFPHLFPMVSEDTVLNELKELVKVGIIKKHGVTKGAKYIMM